MRKTLMCSLLIFGALTANILASRNSFNKGAGSMGVMAVVAYKPRPGKEQALLDLTKEHVPILRAQGMATDRPAYAMRAKDGTIVEVFEWKSKEAINSAHSNAAVQALWKRYEEACEYTPLAKIKECNELFAEFEPVDIPVR